jgi:hypothetical protein
MRLRTYVATTAAIAALSLAGSAAGQSNDDVPPVFMGSVHAIPLPDGDGAWVLQVVSRGGFTGRGAGDVVVISDGRVRRVSSGTESLGLEALEPLAQRIRRASSLQWTGSRLSRCNDCVATLVVLTVRERDGVVRTYSSFWDSATFARIPDDVREIHQVALNISRP